MNIFFIVIIIILVAIIIITNTKKIRHDHITGFDFDFSNDFTEPDVTMFDTSGNKTTVPIKAGTEITLQVNVGYVTVKY